MTMSADHKAALAEGRAQSKAVRIYLEALEKNKPKRGRKRTPDSMRSQLETVEAQLANGVAADPVKRLELIQQRMDLTAEIERAETSVDVSKLEDDFVAAAAGYGSRKGISYAAWRALGVEPGVLKKAGITRGS